MSARHAAPVTVVSHALLPPDLAQAHSLERQAWQAALPTHLALRQAQRQRQPHDAEHLDAPHEWVQAQAMGWPMQAGLLGWAAQTAQQLGLSCPSAHGWAFIDLVHWRVDQGQVHLHHPGTLSPDEDQALLRSMSAYFLEDGIHLHAFEPGRWLAHSTHFQHLPSASLDQVMGRSMAAWLNTDELAQQNPTQRLLRRLQNEMQMLLYTHPVNDERAISLNSFWWSGTGDAPPPSQRTVTLHTDLRDAYLAQDPQAWGLQWQRVLHEVMLPALQRGALVLCGEQAMVHLQTPPHSFLRRLKNLWPPAALHEVLS
jgi:hypothetical protein